MDALPTSWTALCALAFILGARHGLDADHLATIDGLTRRNARSNPRLARLAGALFSLGHGAVVLTVALVTFGLASQWKAPEWLEVTGGGVSIAFLFGLAVLNVHAVVTSDPGAVVQPAGIKGRLLGRFATVRRPWAVAAVGALFAMSFDTISQAALFAVAAAHLGGLAHAGALALVFVLGMLLVDGINGLWISRLIRRADRTAAVASRVMALAVAALSFAVGLVTLGKLALPRVDAWTEAHSLALGGGLVVAVGCAFVLAMALGSARRTRMVSASDLPRS